jgi:hypothetical protein
LLRKGENLNGGSMYWRLVVKRKNETAGKNLRPCRTKLKTRISICNKLISISIAIFSKYSSIDCPLSYPDTTVEKVY